MFASKESPQEEPIDITAITKVMEGYTPIPEPVEKEFVFDDPVLLAICTCESSLGSGKPEQFEADGVTVRTGRVDPRDTGACQINTYYHLDTSKKLGYDIYTLEGNWGYAKYLKETQGTRPWNASRSCWQNKI